MITSILFYVFILAVVFLFVKSVRDYFRARKYKPKPWFSPPIIGDTLSVIASSVKKVSFIETAFQKATGDRTRIHFFGNETIITRNPADLKRLFRGEGDIVQSWLPSSIQKLERNAITNTVGPKHDILRKVLFRLFTKEALAAYFPTMLQIVRKEIESWSTQPQPVKLQPLVTKMTF